MYRPPDIETIEDFNQYYRGAYIGLANFDNEGGHRYLPMYVRGNLDGKSVSLRGTDGVDRTFTFKRVMDEAQFGSPQYGAVEVGNSVVYVSKKAARTVERGHRPARLNMHQYHVDPVLDHMGTLAGEEYLTSLFNPTYRGIEDARVLLATKKRIGAAVARHFALCTIEGYTVPCLFYKTRLIGYVPKAGLIDLEDYEQDSVLVHGVFPGMEVS